MTNFSEIELVEYFYLIKKALNTSNNNKKHILHYDKQIKIK